MAEGGEARGRCPFRLPAPAGVRLTGRFPESVLAGAQTGEGSVEISSREAVVGVTAQAADVFLVTGDQVVTMPLVQDAIGIRWTGDARTLPAVGSLMSCRAEPLPPGVYALYARVVVTPDDGAPQACFGGP